MLQFLPIAVSGTQASRIVNKQFFVIDRRIIRFKRCVNVIVVVHRSCSSGEKFDERRLEKTAELEKYCREGFHANISSCVRMDLHGQLTAT